MKLKAIFMDLDNTVYAYDAVNRSAGNVVVDYLEQKLTLPPITIKEAIALARNEVHHANPGQAAGHSRLLYFQKAIEALTHHTDSVLSLACEKLFWGAFLEEMELFPDVEEFLLEMRSAYNQKIVVVTDLTAQIQLQKLITLGINNMIDFVVSSEEAGVEKPDGRIFQIAFQKCQCDPSEVVMIGDSYEKDCLGALNNGIKQVFCRHIENDHDYPIKMFSDFAQLKRAVVDLF